MLHGVKRERSGRRHRQCVLARIGLVPRTDIEEIGPRRSGGENNTGIARARPVIIFRKERSACVAEAQIGILHLAPPAPGKNKHVALAGGEADPNPVVVTGGLEDIGKAARLPPTEMTTLVELFAGMSAMSRPGLRQSIKPPHILTGL